MDRYVETAAGLGLGLVFALAFGFLLSHVLYGVERVAALRHD